MSRIASLREAVRTIPNFPKPGIQFRDITPILARPDLLEAATEALAAPFADAGVTKVLGIESRGFILGPLLAHRLQAGFVPVRKEDKLPAETYSVSYQLEYGTDAIEMHVDALDGDDRILIHDDVIATGGTAAATFALAQQANARVVGYSFLIELEELGGRSKLGKDIPIHAVIQF